MTLLTPCDVASRGRSRSFYLNRKMDNFEFNRNIQLVVVRDNFSFCVFIVGIPIVFHDSTFAKDRQNV